MPNISVNVSDEMFTVFAKKCDELDMSNAALARSYIADGIGYDISIEDAAREAAKESARAERTQTKTLIDLVTKAIKANPTGSIEDIVARVKAENPSLQ